MIGILYGGVIFIATFLGACAGLGGGVIIKPVLDIMSLHDLSTISFLSTTAVFTMSVYSTIKQIRNKVEFDYKMILLIAIGAMIGGNIGNTLFNSLMQQFNSSMIKGVQAICLTILLIAVLININTNMKTYHIQHPILILLVGFLLGVISSFLGIGGGPINVAVFAFFFSIDMKKAAVYSIATILFSQGSKLLTIGMTTGFMKYDLTLLWFILPAAILGAIVGTYAHTLSKEKTISRIFTGTVFLIILLNIYNAMQAFNII